MTLRPPTVFLCDEPRNGLCWPALPHWGQNVNPFGGQTRRYGMETFAALLTTGDPVSLACAVVAFGLGGLLLAIAVRVRPRTNRR